VKYWHADGWRAPRSTDGITTAANGRNGPATRGAAAHAAPCDPSPCADDSDLHRHHGRQARLAVDPLRARVCRSRHGRRLRRLVRDRRSVPPAARTADTAHGYRPQQQGPDRQGARQFHHQQFPYCRGDERKIGAHRYGGRARPVALRAGQCQTAGRLCRAAIAADCKVPAAAAHRRIDRHNCAAGRAGGPGRAGGVEAVGDRVGAR